MWKRVVSGVVVLAVLGTGGVLALQKYCPGLWTWVDRKTTEVIGWNESARQADPVGFIEYARSRLQEDLQTMQRSRRELAAEIGTVSDKIRQMEALRDQARRLAEEFRQKYQQAVAHRSFPIQVRGASYIQEQAKSQVSLLLAEAEGYQASLAKLAQVRKEAENQLEKLTVRINQTEAQLAALGAQREILQARQSTKLQTELVAQVEALMDENSQVLAANPVRSVQELLAAAEKTPQERAQKEAVEAFLAARTTEKPASAALERSGSAGEQKPAGSAGEQKPAGSATPAKPPKPTPSARTASVSRPGTEPNRPEQNSTSRVDESAPPAPSATNRSASTPTGKPEKPQPSAREKPKTPPAPVRVASSNPSGPERPGRETGEGTAEEGQGAETPNRPAREAGEGPHASGQAAGIRAGHRHGQAGQLIAAPGQPTRIPGNPSSQPARIPAGHPVEPAEFIEEPRAEQPGAIDPPAADSPPAANSAVPAPVQPIFQQKPIKPTKKPNKPIFQQF